MAIKTFIKGKDSSLEDSIANMKTILKTAGFVIEEVSWLNPVEKIYSVHIRDKNCPTLFTNGKGSCKKSCIASAYGEFLERLATNYFFADFFIAANNDFDFLYFPNEKKINLTEYKTVLNTELWQLYDVNNQLQAEHLLSLNDSAKQITCLPMQNVFTNQSVYFPVNIFSNLYASNGLCAGNTFLEAKVQGLAEIFERWVKAKILTENICLPEIPNTHLAAFANLTTIIQDLKKHGLEVSVRDASLGGKYPVISVILFEQETGQCFASFGAHPIFEVAVERTLTEALQGRHLGSLDGFQTPVFDQQLVADDENIENHFIDSSGLIHAKFISQDYDYKFIPWDFSQDIQQQYNYLIKKIKQLGYTPYSADYKHFKLPTSRIIVPGMSEVFPIAEIIENNQNQGRKLREILQSLVTNLVTDNNLQLTLESIEQLGLTDHQGVANLIGLLPDKTSYWQKLKVIELKMFLQLAAKNYQEAFDTLQDCFYFVDHKPMQTYYKALSFALEIKLYENQATYNNAMLIKLFGKEITNKVNKSITGELFIYGLPLGNQTFQQSKAHQTLLQIYKKVQQQKVLKS